MYAAYHTKLGGTSSPYLSHVHSKNFRCPFSSSMAFWSIIALLQSCQVDAFLECAVLSFLDLPDSFWSAWGRWLDKVAVMVHLDLKLVSLSTAALTAQCMLREVLQLSLLHALLSWVKNRTLYSENVAKGGNLSFMGKKTDPFGISEWVSPCNNPIRFSWLEGWDSEFLLS